MPTADELNATLAAHHPAAFACLSTMGREAAFPTGIPAQAAEARGVELQATLGQLTDGQGRAIVPDALDSLSRGDGSTAYLYSPVTGLPRLRALWHERLRRQGSAPMSLPLVTLGLTHGLSLCADMFTDAQTDVVVPTPMWGNYRLVFGFRRQASLVGWNFFNDAGGLDVQAFADAIAKVRTRGVVILNFPGNPTGYSPTEAEAKALVDVLAAHDGPPLTVILDDAYHGFVFEPDIVVRSLFWEVAERCSPDKVLAVKVDGCTKELLFFGGRVGFLTFAGPAAATAALVNKAQTITRATVNCPPAATQVMAIEALADPAVDQQIAAIRMQLDERYRILKTELAGLDGDRLRPLPFNAGFFALIQVHESLDVHAVRRRLLSEQSAGVIALPSVNALRVAFCSIGKDDIPELVARISRVV
ncbi:MAG: aminotransferase class I/II-fold pyridoxal phosphate-dependent enzyme [Proteobacteria bacterium]|nr:aminotransferase class I/II-fold pyridoxal phosphate-dependent enzyme [Pseudomonadota bacterium]